MLRQFAGRAQASLLAAALRGSMVGCVAASEPGGGSDLTSVATTAAPVAGGWRIRGEKRFVTLATEADFAIVLARITEGAPRGGLGAFVVPRDGYEIVETHRLVAGSPLDTSWVRVDATVPAGNLLGRPGLGLAVLNWGLTKERLAITALVVGACRLALTLAVTHAVQRRQFGVRLFDHQAIRLRLAGLDAELHTLESDLRRLAVEPAAARRVAGLKVTAARFGERCLSECMHVFGGDGYVEGATPLGRLWRDIRLARIGGGTDEIMWEIVATGLQPDLDLYARHVSRAVPDHPLDPGET
jgi:acyl-ACP dehydrogenase